MEYFADLLTKAGITKAELSRRISVSPRTVSSWGQRPPQYATAYLELLIRFNRIAP